MAKSKLKPAASPVLPKDLTGKSKSKGQDEKSFNISVSVHGGMPSEKFNFNFKLNKDHQLECDLECQMSKRKAKLKKSALKETELKKLVRGIEKTGILNSSVYKGQFVPCTLVGTLNIELGDKKFQTHFIADEEQAKMQKSNSPEIENAIELIYKMAAKKLKVKSVKP